jgi:hypothetical protein
LPPALVYSGGIGAPDVPLIEGGRSPGEGRDRPPRTRFGGGGATGRANQNIPWKPTVRGRGFSIVYTANSLRFMGVKKRAGLTCRYPCCVVVPTTTIGVISNACDLLRATPSAGPGT